MRYFYFIIAIISLSLVSCRDDFSFEASTGGLEFSKDTVYLDTVFTNIGSSTYRLKVYNRSDKDIFIPKIQLNKGVNSKYRIMVDGMTGDAGAQGKIFSNVELMAKDSLFIFIEVTADVASANPTDFLYTDKINFVHGNGEIQKVELVTLIQDAIFIYPDRTLNSVGGYDYEHVPYNFGTNDAPFFPRGKILSGSLLNWNSTKPYVVYGFAFVPDNETLNIASGTRVYFHDGSGIMIAKDGAIVVNGTYSNPNYDPLDTTGEVIFEGDRLEYSFDDVPGQWFGIMNFSTSNANYINHLTIKNATVGIYNRPLDVVNNPNTAKLSIYNSKIQNCSYAGILSMASTINSTNLVINNCGQFCLGLIYGGNYTFTHCTFNNNWNSSKQSAIYLDDYLDDSTINNFSNTSFTNCIVYGSNQKEIASEFKNTSNNQNCVFNNCLIKYSTSTPFSLANNNIVFNQDPKFKNVYQHKLWPTENLNNVILPATTIFTTDILGKNRTNVGAYEHITN